MGDPSSNDARARAREAYRERKRNGRMALPGFHVADVMMPQKLIALGLLRPDQEDDRAAIRDATIQLLDELDVAQLSHRWADTIPSCL